jgi:hypothetical protein
MNHWTICIWDKRLLEKVKKVENFTLAKELMRRARAFWEIPHGTNPMKIPKQNCFREGFWTTIVYRTSISLFLWQDTPSIDIQFLDLFFIKCPNGLFGPAHKQ